MINARLLFIDLQVKNNASIGQIEQYVGLLKYSIQSIKTDILEIQGTLNSFFTQAPYPIGIDPIMYGEHVRKLQLDLVLYLESLALLEDYQRARFVYVKQKQAEDCDVKSGPPKKKIRVESGVPLEKSDTVSI